MRVIRDEWPRRDNHKWLVLVERIWMQRLGRDRKTTLENQLGNGIWFAYPQCIRISRHKTTLMCVCVSWLLCFGCSCWRRDASKGGVCKWRRTVCAYVSRCKYWGDSSLSEEALVIPKVEKHLNCFDLIVGIKSQTSQPIILSGVRKRVSDPQNSCRAFETLNKGQCSSKKSTLLASSVESVRTTLWQLNICHYLLRRVGGKCQFLLECLHWAHAELTLLPR